MLATVYTAQTGVTTKTNPLLPDATGRVLGYLEPGTQYYWQSLSGTSLGEINAVNSGFAAGTPWYNVEDPAFGAKGDGVTDDTAAIQAAIDAAALTKGVVIFLSRYRVTTLNVPPGVSLVGNYQFQKNGVPPATLDSYESVLIGTAGADILYLDVEPYNGTEGPAILGNLIKGLVLSGGRDQIRAENGAIGLTLEDILFNGPSRAGFHTQGFVQEFSGTRLDFVAGEYGYWHENIDGINDVPQRLFDKSTFNTVYCHGQSKNGFNIDVLLSNCVTWYDLRLVRCAEHGFVGKAGATGWLFVNPNSEGNGFLGVAATATTTGTISGAPTTTITVASGTGYSNGDEVTIQGAGATGADLVTTIVSGGGTTTWTLAASASTNVTNTEVTKGKYSDFSFGIPTGGSAGPHVQMVSGRFGAVAALAILRYAIDTTAGVSSLNLYGCHIGGRPVYDPNSLCTAIQTNGIVFIRRVLTLETFSGHVLAPQGYASVVGTSNGQPFWVGMRDSLGNGTGTYGNFETRRFDGNRTRTFGVRQSDGALLMGASGNSLWVRAAGSPEASIVSNQGGFYARSDSNGQIYYKASGSSNTGWELLSPELQTLTYSATIATNARLGTYFRITATNGNAFTISNPTNPLNGKVITYDILNSSGGAMGAITWGAALLLAGAFTNPANTFRRTISFAYDGTNWVETGRAAADI